MYVVFEFQSIVEGVPGVNPMFENEWVHFSNTATPIIFPSTRLLHKFRFRSTKKRRNKKKADAQLSFSRKNPGMGRGPIGGAVNGMVIPSFGLKASLKP